MPSYAEQEMQPPADPSACIWKRLFRCCWVSRHVLCKHFTPVCSLLGRLVHCGIHVLGPCAEAERHPFDAACRPIHMNAAYCRNNTCASFSAMCEHCFGPLQTNRFGLLSIFAFTELVNSWGSRLRAVTECPRNLHDRPRLGSGFAASSNNTTCTPEGDGQAMQESRGIISHRKSFV
jgi:hypothetical protein